MNPQGKSAKKVTLNNKIFHQLLLACMNYFRIFVLNNLIIDSIC